MAITISERAKAIQRAKRGLKALNEHPDTSRHQLGAARDRLNDCYRLTDAGQVWKAVDDIETLAAQVHGVPAREEPAPRSINRWVSPRGRPRPARRRRARSIPSS